ncbi:MAG TPA: ABC transporter substrate-binding protein [Bacillota bacterium]|nr:ABC transporter substrate-binding protein [Bacillota bacterium]
MTKTRSNRRYSLIVVFLVMLMVLSSMCVGAQDTKKSTGDIVIVDGLGREIRLQEPVKRVYNTYGIAATMVYALGAQDKLVGLDPATKEKAVYVAWPPRGRGEFNIEEVIALDADFVLASAGNRDLIENIEAHGINVFGVSAEDLDQLTDSMVNLAKAFGKEDRARQFVNYYDDMVGKLASKTSELAAEERPGVYLVGSSLLSTCGREMYQHHLIELAGGRNVAVSDDDRLIPGKRWVEISPEQIVKWNPDIIVAVQYAADTTPEQILADERFAGVDAVKNGQVFWFPSNLIPWDYPSPQAILGIEWLAKKLHPDLFEDLDVMNEADKFFNMLYGRTYSELGGVLD